MGCCVWGRERYRHSHHTRSIGRSVSVLEARAEVGGLCTDEDTTTVQPWAVSELGLEVEWAEPHPITLVGAKHRRSIKPNDAGLEAWRLHVDSFRDVIIELSTHVAPDIRRQGSLRTLIPAALSGLKLGRAAGLELARIGPLAAEDWLDEWGIDRITQAALILPALRGAWMGPRSPTGALAVLFHHALASRHVDGGSAALVAALKKRATALGISLQTDAQVTRIRIEEGKAVGVVLADETTLDADLVVSTVGPSRTLLDLVSPSDLPASAYESIRNYRTRGIVGHVASTVSTPLFDGAAHIVVADDTVMLERGSTTPSIVGFHASCARIFQTADQVQILVYGAAHDLDGGWDDALGLRS